MKCPKCGKEIANDNKFCEYCGAQLNLTTSVEKKKTNWFGIIGGSILLIMGLFMMFHSWGHTSQSENITPTGTGYYGTFFDGQYIYEGLCEAIQKNYNWNSTSYKPEQGNYEVTNVYYNGEYLLQVVPYIDARGVSGTLSIYVQVPPAKLETFKRLKSFSYFEEDTGWANIYYANCQNNVSLTAKIASDIIQNLFDVPRGATLNFSDN